ncbi:MULTISPECIES: hypothetical protein [Pedobacter]|uniref:hypothetical protein n=1 Tax=Pedobacter TaxID=84567 RepID=UPI001E31CEC0|nr:MULTISPECIES: hypothetical protein [Pedobacter]
MLSIKSLSISIIVWLFLCFNPSFAQKKSDYVILKSGDTIFTDIVRKSNDFFFKVKQTDTLEKITADNIKAFFIVKNKIPLALKYVEGKDKPVYLTILESGKINLFESSSSNSVAGVHISGMAGSGTFGGGRSSDITYYAQNNGADSLLFLKTNGISKSNAKGRLCFENLISDDKELFDFYKSKEEYSFDVIRAMIKAYNRRHTKVK